MSTHVPDFIKTRLESDKTSLDLSTILGSINEEISNAIQDKDEEIDQNALDKECNKILKTKYKLFPFPSQLLLNYTSTLTHLTLNKWPTTTDRYRWPPDAKTSVSELKNRITIPDCIYDLKNLQHLKMYYYPFPYLSSNIGKLSNLQTLSIGGCSLIRLPRSIKNLQKLFKFSTYSGSHRLHYMPYEITLCSKLKESQMSTRALLNSRSCYLLFPPLPIYPNNIVDKDKLIISKNDLCEYLNRYSSEMILPYTLIELIINEYHSCKETFCSNVDICGNDKVLCDYIYYGWGYKRIASYDNCGILIRACSIKCLKQCLENSIEQKEWFTNAGGLTNDYRDSGSIKYEQNLSDGGYIFDINNWKQKKWSTRLYAVDMDVYWINFWKFNLEIDFESYQYIVENGWSKLCVRFICK